VVVERGAKARVVTAGDSGETVRGHALRDLFWPLLESLPVAFRGESDEDARAIRVLREKVEGFVVVSTDLSAATDYATFDLAKAVWSGVFAGLVERGDLNQSEASLGLREVLIHLGPHTVDWPTESGVSRRGWLMGHPLTWLTLNLSHCAILDMVGLLGQAVVKGDDALVYCPRDNALDYMEALELAGFVVNKGKTFFSTGAGVFCERLYKVACDPGLRVPLKSIVLPTVERLSNLAVTFDALPRRVRKTCVEVLWSRASEVGLIGLCRKHGLPISLPRELGGLGLPHRRRLSGALVAHRRWATFCVTSATAGEVIPSWEPPMTGSASQQVRKDLRWVSRTEHNRGNLGSQVPLSDESFRRFIGVRAFGLTLAKPFEASTFRYSDVARMWVKARKALSHTGTPKNLINPSLWTWARLKGCIAAQSLAGIYSTDWTVRTVQQGHLRT